MSVLLFNFILGFFIFFVVLFLGMVMYDNGFEAKENKIFYIKDKIEPQHLHSIQLKKKNKQK